MIIIERLSEPVYYPSLDNSNCISMSIRSGDICVCTMIAKFNFPGEGILAIKYLYKYLIEERCGNLITTKSLIRVLDASTPFINKYFNNCRHKEYFLDEKQLKETMINDYKEFIIDSFKNMIVDFGSEESLDNLVIWKDATENLDWDIKPREKDGFPDIIVISGNPNDEKINSLFMEFLYGQIDNEY